MSHEEHSSSEDQSDISEQSIDAINDDAGGSHYNSSANNYGFTAMEDPEVAKEKKRKRDETPEARNLKREIQTLLCRYPTLVPRTSHEVMEKLNAFDDDELNNIYLNCLNDVSEIRGNPIANTVIYGVTSIIDSLYLPGFTEECMADVELKRNIESTVTVWLGRISTAAQMAFQFGNNAYIAARKRSRWESTNGYEFRPFNYNPNTFEDQLKKKEEEEKKKATLITPVHERDTVKDTANQQNTQTAINIEPTKDFGAQAFAK